MKNSAVILIIINFLSIELSYCQRPVVTKKDSILLFSTPATKGTNEFSFNRNSYVRVLDGFLLGSKPIPKGTEIFSKRKISDINILNKMGVKYPGKPVMFFNSRVTPFHDFIYKRLNESNIFYGINLPLIVNNELITPEKYYKVEKLDTLKVAKINFIKKSSLPKYANLITGAIIVTTKKN
jgi:hypothetical protein